MKKCCPNCGINLEPIDKIARVGDLTIDLSGDCWWRGRYVTLTPSELVITHALAAMAGDHIRAEGLLNIIDSASEDNNIISVLMNRIRRKFEAVDPSFNRLPRASRRIGRGYCWQVDRDAESPCEPALASV